MKVCARQCAKQGQPYLILYKLGGSITHILYFPLFFLTRMGLANHSGWYTSLMNPTAKSFAISSSMALRFPSSKRRRRCFTGLEPHLIFKACSAMSLGMPDMSEGFHSKMSLFARRKSLGVLSYLEESVVPMRTTLSSKLLGSMRTSLTPSVGSKDPASRLESGASSAVPSLMTVSSSEAIIAEACSQHSTSHS